MLNQTYKIKHLIIKAGSSLALLLLCALVLPSSITYAASHSQTYAVMCAGTDVVVKGNQVSCRASPAVLRLEGVGGAKKPYPQGSGIAVVTVNCGSSTPINPSASGPVDFKCHNGSSPKIGNARTIQHGGAATPPAPVTATPGDPAAQIAACRANPSGPNCGSNTNAYCGPNNCDLVEKYVNPLIDVVSIAFGIIAVISIILGGIQYSASAGDPQKITAAKQRIAQTLYAILAYAFLFAILQFLVPGGVFH